MNSLKSSGAPLKHLLVTTDFSPAAEPALEAAADLARRTGARVTVLNVLDFSGLGDSRALRESLVGLEREYRGEVTPHLQARCERVFKQIPMEIVLIEGLGGASTICTYARENAVDLIVIATHGRTGMKRFVLGSVTERVVQHAPCDVMVVRSSAEPGGDAIVQLRKILVPTDFSKSADQALERAVQLAKLAQGEIHLMHAYELPTTVGVIDVPLAIPQEFFDQLRDAAQRYLDDRVKRASAQGVKVHAYLTCDAPTRGILAAAEKVAPDLIVMGTHGRTGVKHVLLGSVAERTVRLAPCPVMTVKAPDA